MEIEKIAVNLKLLYPNTVLSYPCYDSKGALIQPGHTPFTKEIIHRLLENGIEKLYYNKPILSNKDYADTNHPDKKKTIQNNNEQKIPGKMSIADLDKKSGSPSCVISVETQKQAIDLIDKLINDVENMLQVNAGDVSNLITIISDEMDTADGEIINLLDIQSYDDYTYTHSINVGILSMYFAKKLRLEKQLVKEIGIGAFLHDIGKLKIPIEIINKPAKLSPEEFTTMKGHPKHGIAILHNSDGLSEISKNIILLHHEKLNGEGYPLGLKEDQIADYVWITSLADVFDALSTKRPYKKAMTVTEALKIMHEQTSQFKFSLLHRFVKELLSLFREHNYYPIGTFVMLNTGEIARIVSSDEKAILRPKLEIMSSRGGKIFKHPQVVDLSTDVSRHILRKVG